MTCGTLLLASDPSVDHLTGLTIAGRHPMSRVVTRVEQDGLGDWRLQAATRLTGDVPAAFPGGPSHKAGTPVHLVTMAASPQHERLGFQTPSAAALALSSGFRSADRATELWPQITYTEVITPDGPGSSVHLDHAPLLFDYFEACVASANSSFQAIEAFANETIARLLKGTIPFDRRDGSKTLNAEEIERKVSTSEKIATVLPKILDGPSIKGRHEWQLFIDLKDVRDASTHFKSGDQYPLSGKVGKDSLYYILMNSDPHKFPLTALRVIWRLLATYEKPRWLSHLGEIHRIG
jgi:hypothetical protein